jgi:hypothetical protein
MLLHVIHNHQLTVSPISIINQKVHFKFKRGAVKKFNLEAITKEKKLHVYHVWVKSG